MFHSFCLAVVASRSVAAAFERVAPADVCRGDVCRTAAAAVSCQETTGVAVFLLWGLAPGGGPVPGACATRRARRPEHFCVGLLT